MVFVDISPIALAGAIKYPRPVIAIGQALYLCRACMGGRTVLDIQKEYGYKKFGHSESWNWRENIIRL